MIKRYETKAGSVIVQSEGVEPTKVIPFLESLVKEFKETGRRHWYMMLGRVFLTERVDGGYHVSVKTIPV